MLTPVEIKMGPYLFRGVMEEERAPETCKAIKKILPIENKVVHARWSGEAIWIPFGDKKLNVRPENHTCMHLIFRPSSADSQSQNPRNTARQGYSCGFA